MANPDYNSWGEYIGNNQPYNQYQTMPPPPTGQTQYGTGFDTFEPYNPNIGGNVTPTNTVMPPPPGDTTTPPGAQTTGAQTTGAQTTSYPSGSPGTPWKDPATGQCYVYDAQGKPQKADAGACGGNSPYPQTDPGPWGPPGTLPPGSPDPGDGPVPSNPPPITNNPGGSPPPVGNPPPQYPGGTPNIDPYQIGTSPDQSGRTGVGGISAVDPQANPYSYQDVEGFADAAWEQSKRYLDPQMEQQDRRYEQQLINKGIDPYSEAGQKAFQQMKMGQNDLMSKSAFDALGFGAGLQDQMFGQSATRSELSSRLLEAQMGLEQRGHEFDTTAGLNANQQAFAQMLSLEGLDYRDYMTLIDQMRYDDSLSLSLLGIGAPPGYSTVNTGLGNASAQQFAADQNMWNTPLFGS